MKAQGRWARFLCAVGLHDWDTSQYVATGYDTCRRCQYARFDIF